MLVIRKEQLDVLGSIPQKQFEVSLIRHFFHFYPQDCARVGEGQIGRLVQLSIDRAAGYGYHSRQEVGFYCNLMLMLGVDFDHDPQIPWAVEQANDWTMANPLERIQRLFETSLTYLAEAFGENGGYLARALVRIRDYDLESAPEVKNPQLETGLLSLFEFLCPQKFKVQGVDPTRALIRRGIEDAARYGISGGRGLSVYITLMFMLGAGFDHDPVYPWTGSILNDLSLIDGMEKARQLYRASIAYVNRVLTE